MSDTKQFGNGNLPVVVIAVLALCSGAIGWNQSNHNGFVTVMTFFGGGSVSMFGWAVMRIVLMRFQRT